MDTPPRPHFDRLAPLSTSYAILPFAEAFNWADCVTKDDEGEWYLVAFRSVLREFADEAQLWEFDERAHREAEAAPGFLHYFKGPANDHRECLSFCVWETRAHARLAAGGPAHMEAIAIAHAMYERYTLEFLRVIKRKGVNALEFEPYDRSSAERVA